MSTTSRNFLQSSLGKKIVMSLTGLFLITFLIVHCIVNSLIFVNDGGELFNKGAEFMGTNPIIRAMEIVLFIGIIWHVVQALIVTLDNNKARPVKYEVQPGNVNSKWYSRSMGLLGTLILMFLIIHLYHFWIESRFTDHIAHSEATKLAGQETMYAEMKEVFENLWVVILYCAAMVSLAYHLMHGFYSAFQTLGLNNKKYTPGFKSVGLWFSIIISLVFAAMPIAMYAGWIK